MTKRRIHIHHLPFNHINLFRHYKILISPFLSLSFLFSNYFLPCSKSLLMPKSAASIVKPKKATSKKASTKKGATKSVAKASSTKKKDPLYIKYEDKSAGQPEMVLIFEAIKKLMKPYHKKGTMLYHEDKGGQIHLISHKAIEVEGRKKPMVWFVSTIIQKGYVGFYYMPIYMNDPMKKLFSPEFIKCLKGKACFHIKKAEPIIMDDIKKAIQVGYEAYEKRGWV